MGALLYLHGVLFCIQRDTRGAVASEYAFLIAFISIAAALGMVLIGAQLSDYFGTLGASIGTSAQQAT